METAPPLDNPLAEQPPPPKERRFKLSRACDRCRRRRIKCDEGHPCQSCLSANSSCTFDEPGKRSHPHKSKRAATLEDRMQHLETLIQAIPANIFNPALSSHVQHSIVNPDHSAASPPLSPSQYSANHAYPLGVPPPSLSAFPLMGPSAHFSPSSSGTSSVSISELADATSRLSLSHSYLYLDDEGSTRWQGETSGLPLLDMLLEQDRLAGSGDDSITKEEEPHSNAFADRILRRSEVNPESLWKAVTESVPPDLMDSLVQVYLSTTYYLFPFLHVPTFLADYGNPSKWGEPGFASFVLSICCIASRHVDDPRVRADPTEPLSAGRHWLDLFSHLRTLPTADRPTLYTIQALFTAAVYAVGLGKLSRAFALLSEAITFSVDAGLHRSVDAYDYFDPLESEIRKRTFWAVYMWDKQAAAAFGRPPMIRLCDCDVTEPAIVDDEYISRDGIGEQPRGIDSRMGAFVISIRLYVMVEAVVTSAPPLHGAASPFLARAAAVMSGSHNGQSSSGRSLSSPIPGFNPASSQINLNMLHEEEALLDDVVHGMPLHWAPTAESMSSDDVVRVTQTERLHCLEQFTRMLIHRHRLSIFIAKRTGTRISPGTSSYGQHGTANAVEEQEKDAMRGCQQAALHVIAGHLRVASKGLMTYYGVHVIHQLTQAGRALLAVLLNCNNFIPPAQPDYPPQTSQADQNWDFRTLIGPSVEALRSCLGLLRRFSGRYVCGLRSADLIEECCRLTRIPLDLAEPSALTNPSVLARARRPWLRPVRKKTTPSSKDSLFSSMTSEPDSDSHSHSQSPETDTPPFEGNQGIATDLGSRLAPSGMNLGIDVGLPVISPSPPMALYMDTSGLPVLTQEDLESPLGGIPPMGNVDLMALLNTAEGYDMNFFPERSAAQVGMQPALTPENRHGRQHSQSQHSQSHHSPTRMHSSHHHHVAMNNMGR